MKFYYITFRSVTYAQRGERLLLALGMTALFLLLALKKDTVGLDTLGYRQQYRIAAKACSAPRAADDGSWSKSLPPRG